MNEKEFDQWWDLDGLMQINPYNRDTPAFWAWEGWVAGSRAEREACAQILDANAAACKNNSMLRDVLVANAAAIRARGES